MEIVCNEKTKRNEIIKLIKHIMIDLNIKNIDIVPKMNQTEQSVSNLLNPNYRPDSSMTIDGLARICQAMGCELRIEIAPIGAGNKDGE